MSRELPVDTQDFRVEVDDDGIAHLVFGAPGVMPTTGPDGHRELARLWPRLAAGWPTSRSPRAEPGSSTATPASASRPVITRRRLAAPVRHGQGQVLPALGRGAHAGVGQGIGVVLERT